MLLGNDFMQHIDWLLACLGGVIGRSVLWVFLGPVVGVVPGRGCRDGGTCALTLVLSFFTIKIFRLQSSQDSLTLYI